MSGFACKKASDDKPSWRIARAIVAGLVSTMPRDVAPGRVDQSGLWPLDRRAQIIEAGLTILRQHGYAGFTQPRIAALAGLRQSHLTYYHPTRLDLLAAVGRAAVDLQLAAVARTFEDLSSLHDAARAIADLVTRHENTRVLMALAQAGDEEPRLRELFRELADGIVTEAMRFMARIGYPSQGEDAGRLFHAVAVGLAVVDLATGRPDGKQRTADILVMALPRIVGQIGPDEQA